MEQALRIAARIVLSPVVTAGLLTAPAVGAAQDSLPYPEMAARIVDALQPAAGELAIMRYDPAALPGFTRHLRRTLEERGVEVEGMRWGVVTGFHLRIRDADIYIALPASPSIPRRPEQEAVLRRWLDAGRGRQVHFHWDAGTRATDGLRGEHSAAFDQVYVAALDIDYEALDRQQEAAIAALQSREVQVTTPAGTDIRFRVGDRPFNKQNGDVSRTRMASARTRIDREIELPAGVLRVAPLEESVVGTMVIPWARFDETEVENLRLEFREGRITDITASTGEAAVRAAIDAAPVLGRFREFGLGFNAKLTSPEGHDWLPYFGYGAGVVRLSLGNNTALGGAVDGDGDRRFAFRWFFFRDATVTVGDIVLVDGGRLVLSP